VDLKGATPATRQSRSHSPSSLQKNLPIVVQTLQRTYPRQQVELWATDQHRIGLKPILRRVWSPRGQRPEAVVQHRYQWCYLYVFVLPETGRTWWLSLPYVSIAAFTVALAEFAQAVGAGRGKQILLVLDGAGWHVSPQLRVPAGIHLYFLPPYSPELQPAERLWPLTNESLSNHHFQDLDELQTAQAHRCLQLQARPEVIEAHTSCHWWPRTA
jgi:transposase